MHFFYGFYVLCDDKISRDGICVDLNYELHFLTRGLGLVYRQNSIEFLINFQELVNLEIMSLGWVWIPVFQTDYDIVMSYEFLTEF